jgi:hypothetical protein
MKSGFNSNFYITAATIIPLLYITIILQASTVRDMQARLDRVMSAKVKSESQNTITLVVITLGFVAAFVIWLTSAAILIVGIGGEIAAILALYYQSDSDSTRLFVLVSTILLLVVSTVGPALTISTAFMRPIPKWARVMIQVLRAILSTDRNPDHNNH